MRINSVQQTSLRLNNSLVWFLKMMNGVLSRFLGKFCNVYIDDMFVYSKTPEHHGHHLTYVLEASKEAHLKINVENS